MLMKKYRLSIEQKDIKIEEFMQNYHFEASYYEMIRGIQVFLMELVEIEVGVCYKEDSIICVVTLGDLFDQLERVVEDANKLMVSYCMECFGMEFLNQAYKKINERVYEDTGKWLGILDFLDEKDFCEIPAILELFHEMSVAWKDGMLHPLKSVVFKSSYSEKKKLDCHHCKECLHATCPFRKEEKNDLKIETEGMFSYGISRIFGGNES